MVAPVGPGQLQPGQRGVLIDRERIVLPLASVLQDVIVIVFRVLRSLSVRTR
ncbi:MAG: hypothetical protein ACRDND_01640 [Streptosporangiaceae bacterium]